MARETKAERTSRLWRELEGAAVGNFNEARRRGEPMATAHDRTMARINAVKRLPSWVRLAVFSAHRAMVSLAHVSGMVEWRVFFEGKHVKSADVPNGRYLDVVADKGAFFWAGTDHLA